MRGLLVLLVLSWAAAQSSPETAPGDVAALRDLFLSTGGEHWLWEQNETLNGMRWNFSTSENGTLVHDPCEEPWQRLDVWNDHSSSYCRAVWLYPYDFNLQGTLPSTLGNLDALEVLECDQNYLEGSIPNDLSKMSSLTYLRLDRNELSQTIPSSLGGLTKLDSLGLYTNMLTGTLPVEFSKLRNLQRLMLWGNIISGTIPVAYGASFPNLVWMWLAFNIITGSIPSFDGNHNSLESLSFDRNFLSGTLPPSIGNLTSLVDFVAHSNKLESSIPSSFSSLENLVHFDLSYNNLTGSLPPHLSRLTSLEFLYLSHNAFTGPFHEGFGQWEKLQIIHLNDNAFSGPLPPVQYQVLEYCLMQNNRFTGRFEGFNGVVGGFDKLVVLDMSANRFSGELPSFVFQVPTLISVALSDNCFTGHLPIAMCDARGLHVMSLDGLGASSQCKHSSSIFLSDVRFFNYLEGAIPECVWSLDNLTTLHLTANGLSGSIVDIGSQSRLRDVRLSHNRLTGSIPVSFQQRYFDVLDLSYNRITGEYTKGANITNESSITLTVNRLSGRLPVAELSISAYMDILLGNIFTCGHLPRNDGHYEDYTCGSEILDASLYLMGASTCLLVLLVCGVMGWSYHRGSALYEKEGVHRGYDFQAANSWGQLIPLLQNQLVYCTVMSELRSSPGRVANVQNVVRYCVELITMMKLWVMLCLLSIVVSVPVYVLKSVDSDATTHDNEYSWQLSWAYTTGEVSALLLLGAWLCLICSFIAAVVYILWLHNTHKLLRRREADCAMADPLSRRRSSGGDEADDAVSGVWNAKTMALLLVNNVVVVGVNILYMYSIEQNLPNSYQLLIQLAVALFKQLNSTFALPSICKYITIPSEAIRVRLRVTILHTLLIPCLVTAFQQPSCLRGIFVPASSVASSYSYEECVSFSYSFNRERICSRYITTEVTLDPLTPPFIYHWQCASVLLSAYVPVFIYAHVFQLTYSVLLIALSFVKYTTLPVWMRAKVPGIAWPDNWLQEGPDVFSAEEAAANKYIIAQPRRLLNIKTVVSYFANSAVILLTFGLCSPYLALAIIASTVLSCGTWLMLIGRFVHFRIHGLPQYEDNALIALNKQVEEATGAVKVCVWPVVISSSLFIAMLSWDMAGDEVGSWNAIYIPCIALCMPVLIWAFIHFFEWRTGQKIFFLHSRKGRSRSLLKRFSRDGSFVNAIVELGKGQIGDSTESDRNSSAQRRGRSGSVTRSRGSFLSARRKSNVTGDTQLRPSIEVESPLHDSGRSSVI